MKLLKQSLLILAFLTILLQSQLAFSQESVDLNSAANRDGFLTSDGSTLTQKLVPSSTGSQTVSFTERVAPAKTYSITQNIQFGNNFDWGGTNEAGKVGFGLAGGSAPSGGQTNRDGFTSRFIWRGNRDGTANLAIYAYEAQRGKWGTDYDTGFSIPKGQAFNATMQVTVNDPGKNNGSVRVLVNGQEYLNKGGILWQSQGTPMVDRIMYSTFYGGGDRSWAPDGTNYISFSDVRYQANALVPEGEIPEGLINAQNPEGAAAKAAAGGGGASGAAGGGGASGAAGGGGAGPIPIKKIWVGAFMLMTEQFTTTMLQQVEIIGTFFDAKHQLETQRLFQQKVARAHKDYHPSEQICEIGTFVRDLANSQERIKVTRNAIQNASLARALRTGDVKSAQDQASGSDQRTRRKAYIDKFCNVTDNAAQNILLCETSKDVAQQNADLNYTQTIDFPLTIKLNFLDSVVTKEEENIFSFLDQIFMNEAFSDVDRANTINHKFVKPYQEMRSLAAMRSVAQNSFAHIIGEKTIGPGGKKAITPFLRSLLEEMGLNDDLIHPYIGLNPSYFAQMEILTKKIYQHPEFFSNLYDKPSNVKRIRAAMSAIKLMQDRDISNAMQRREMLTSMILELQLRYKQNDLGNKIEGIIANLPEIPNSTDPETGVYGDGSQNQFGVGTFNEQTGTGGF